jgi:xanthine dehydrogenase/oxidase
LQVAAADLGIPLSSVYIAETATDKVPNSSPTAASASSDMYGSAAADACAQLNARLKPYREQRPDSTFTELVNAAYLDRVDLSAHGFYATPDVTGDLKHLRNVATQCYYPQTLLNLDFQCTYDVSEVK